MERKMFNTTTVLIQSQINPVHILTYCFFKSHFKLQDTAESTTPYLPSGFHTKIIQTFPISQCRCLVAQIIIHDKWIGYRNRQSFMHSFCRQFRLNTREEMTSHITTKHFSLWNFNIFSNASNSYTNRTAILVMSVIGNKNTNIWRFSTMWNIHTYMCVCLCVLTNSIQIKGHKIWAHHCAVNKTNWSILI